MEINDRRAVNAPAKQRVTLSLLPEQVEMLIEVVERSRVQDEDGDPPGWEWVKAARELKAVLETALGSKQDG